MADTPRRVLTRAAAAAASSTPPAGRPKLESQESTASSAPSSREDSPEATTTITTVHHYRRRRSAAGVQREEEEDASGAEHVTSTTEIHHTGGASTHEVGKDGSISIRPMPRGGRRLHRLKIRKVVNFKHRTSTFDRSNPASTSDQFRGFYTLFWIFLAVGTFRTLQSSYENHGSVLGLGFFQLFSEDAKVLALTDAALVGSSFLCVPFAKILQKGWIRYHYTGLVIQHLGQTLWLAGWIRWTFFRQWPWVQSGFLVLHALSMLMKLHSYCAVNGDLSEKHRRAKSLQAQLESAVSKRGGWDGVLKEAQEVKASDDASSQKNGTTEPDSDLRRRSSAKRAPSPLSAPNLVIPNDLSSSATLRSRRRRSSAQHSSPLGSGSKDEPGPATAEVARLRLLADHYPDVRHEADAGGPGPSVGDLAAEAVDLLDSLTNTVDGVVTWPQNVTFLNFWDYLLVPSLVYDTAFPRTQGIRPLYILEKVAATIGVFSLLYIVTQAYVWDQFPKPEDGFVAGFTKLLLPFMVNYLLLFFIIFECICNAFAEITRFADREFYSDWWNSTSFEEFSRKWNKPVHNFLLRHVYASTISAYGLSKSQAALITFFLSAVMHELLMAVVTKKIRLYLFAMQMAQLPLITLSQAKFFKQHPALGNLFFWIGLMSGFPLLGACYILY